MSDLTDIHRRIVGERGSVQRIVVASFGVGVLAFCVSAAPAMLDRGHAWDDAVQGHAPWIAGLLALLMLVTGLAARGSFRADGSGRPSVDRSWRVLGSWAVTGVTIIAALVWRDYRLAADLSAHGVATQAHLVHQFDRSCGKTGCSIMLEYRFVPRGRALAVRGFASVGYGGRSPDPAYAYALATGTVPILYDPDRPSRSMLYWSDRIARRGSARQAWTLFAVLTAILLAVLALFALFVWLGTRKRDNNKASEKAGADQV